MKDRLETWAAANAFTLAFILLLFVITWAWIFVADVFLGKWS